ncbi:nucleic acid-binding protein [Conchiformibius kuhniae]|uniref:Nucleic acid-binding protein n=1 Tax=Conchiformibius kuhniae TaxID=211502 RepID=A0ABD8B7K9_9NEIS|nr:nucleic acid-binding protein [Conchiformibius kuhniae]
MIVLDNNALVFLYRPAGGQQDLHHKMQYLFDEQKRAKKTFGIPAPALAEFLIGEPNPAKRQEFLSLFSGKSKVYQILDFDMKSSVMCTMISDIMNNRPNECSKEPRQKVKVDRQILAIAISNKAKLIISNDKGLLNAARYLAEQQFKIQAVDVSEITVPVETQSTLF